IVHMSTEELAASKEPILGTYDLIYVGGNKSALKEPQNWRNVAGLMNWGYMSTTGTALENYKYFPIYTMYTHNGDMVAVSVSSLGYSGGDVKSGSPAAEVYLNGAYQKSFSLLNGNDISYDRLLELRDYIDKDMPIIVEKSVADAYDAVVNNPDGNEYLQNSIDPDSNMRKFLDSCYARKTTDGSTSPAKSTDPKTTVLWGISNTSDDPTFIDYDKVNSLVKGSSSRPKLTVTSMPVTYNYYDTSTRLSEGTLNFSFEVDGISSSGFSVKLRIDDDGTNTFTTNGADVASEFSTTTSTDNKSGTLKCTLSDKYFGPVSWMLEVTDKGTGLTAYTKGISYIKNKTGKKQTVRVLQIMPGAAKEETNWQGTKLVSTHGEGAQGSNALYFCPICQQTYERLEFNPIANSTSQIDIRYSGTGAYLQSNTTASTGHTTDNNPYLGQHEHIFGLPKYDSAMTLGGYTGVDDWSTNLADDVGDLYDFDLDILLRGEFEEYSRKIAAAYDFSSMSAADKATKINNFSIDASDPDYAEWSALTTDDAKLKFITKREYQQLANGAYQNYVQAKTDTEAAIPALETALNTAIASNTGGYAGDLTIVLKTRRYSDIFSAIGNGGCFRYTYPWQTDQLNLANAYFDYRDLKEKEITYHNQYKDYNRYAYPDNWLLGCYDMIIIGPSDDFAGDDMTDATALADLIDYMNNDGSLLLFHDTLTASRNSGSHVMTATLRDYFGMNRNRGLTRSSSAAAGMYYLPYTSTGTEDRYFMTNLSYKPKTDTTRYASWVNDIKVAFNNFDAGSRYLTDVEYTDSFATSDYGTNGASGGSPYKYGQQYWELATSYFKSSNVSDTVQKKENGNYGTDKASQNNKGIVTQYPFTLSDELNISPTHAQHYALELDASKMTVWYSLAGGNNKAVNGKATSASSMYAASRNDGMDNYFIYSYGNVNYCGAGHSKVTGVYKDNNDERRLYINIIVNSVKNSVNQPGITVYDYKTEKKKEKDGTDYLMEVKDTEAWPEFSFSATVDTSEAGNKLERVRIYYDLDYVTTNSDSYVNDQYHILIADMTKDADGNPLKSGTIYDVGKTLTALQLKPEYFEPYNQEYTYIVIEVTDSKNNIAYQRIKIKLLPYLFEMTQNSIIDIIDKI
ncbi:MAG: DUF5057 domain-containing protein, partial [Lachnospiraceae bacterium]|nr:DUF5057 domain-containing protein [Lachnospiraceae bacterium]